MNDPNNMQTNPITNLQHPASLFFIQPSEGAASLLVPDLLTIENFMTWARTMRRALNIKNKFGFINGKIIKPIDPSNHLFAPWEERYNNMIIAWIQHSAGLKLKPNSAYADTVVNI